ncbi:MAG: homoserine kinase [Pseudomonadota bacterium]|nr:homoserine kinase [Pseudomonadota bacterium]
MAVYTEVPFDAAAELVLRLNIGRLTALEGCSGGIENTNYFADTTQGRYVLTLFERLSAAQLPFYLRLMKHLAQRGIPVPDPCADAQGEILHTLQGKPAAVVDRLKGSSRLAPDAEHCRQLGAMLARMHVAGRDFPLHQPHLRGLAWWVETVPVVLPFLNPSQCTLIETELAFQQHVAQSAGWASLPRGPVHADLFRDNVMFDQEPLEGTIAGPGSDRLSGLFDFYFAGVDTFVFDIAVCINDWCIDLASGRLDEDRASALVAAYQAVRPFNGAELRLFPAMLRGAALRFWISRLWDLHLPRDAAMLTAHDPTHFERVLRQRVETPWHPTLPESRDATPDTP